VSGSLFVRNVSNGDMNYSTFGGAMAFVTSVDHCTIVDNEASGGFDCGAPLGYSAPCWGGGVFASGPVTNSIVRGNDPDQLNLTNADYSNVEDGAPGIGNIDVDPGFVDAANDDYRLRADSPCIDAGNPLGPPDADGTPPDLGAYAFAPALWSPTTAISASAGGTQAFEVHAGTVRAGDFYWVLGSVTGTSPGLSLDSWLLPLVPDAWFAYTLGAPNSALLPSSLGVVGASGIAAASLALPAGLDPALVGATLHHAFATVDAGGMFAVVSGTSNAFDVTLAP